MKNYKNYLFILVFIFISIKINAQEFNVVDNKGTINSVFKNKVTTSPTASPPASKIEGDVWFDTTASEIKIYDGSIWKKITNINTLSDNIYTTDGTLTSDRAILGDGKSIMLDGLNRFDIIDNQYISLHSLGGILLQTTDSYAITLDANTSVEKNLYLKSGLLDTNYNLGTTGQILSSTGTATEWIDNTASVYTGSFIIDAPTTTTTDINFDKIITGLPFKPSQITFVAHANIESFDTDSKNSDRRNSNTLQNSFGTMNGFARYDKTPATTTQSVIFVGGSGNSINDISRLSSNSNCIGLRYGDKDAIDLGKIMGNLTSFNNDGFTINVKYTLGTSGNTTNKQLIFKESLIVLYTAYK
ncbi:hypothetical protein [Tenacibaculum piscium]|uniref:hypothetical protein n=1 Tax=Tenacibaculum piscium TaxID=1458515 RepID=UPI001F47C0B0|nr:hypothetical protein [Tenacibaculum piscium]